MEYEGDPTEIPSKSSLPLASGALEWVGYSTPGPWEAPGGGSVCKALATEGSVTPAGLGHADWRDGQSNHWRRTHPCRSVI